MSAEIWMTSNCWHSRRTAELFRLWASHHTSKPTRRNASMRSRSFVRSSVFRRRPGGRGAVQAVDAVPQPIHPADVPWKLPALHQPRRVEAAEEGGELPV